MQSIDLRGRKALIVGVANKESLAWWAARHIKDAGADIAMTYLNDKAKRYVAPLADELGAELLLPCDVAVPGELDAVFDTIRNTWGKLDIVFHAIAWARKEDLHGRLTDCSAEGFSESMLISVHSFIRMARLAEPLMSEGGSLITLSYYGAEKVVDHYNVMGPVKAALEATVRYLAHELGPKGVRVNAISAGPIRTRAASGIEHFDELLAEAAAKAPLRRTVEACEVGRVSVLLASDFGASITGEVIHADAGFHVAGMIFH
jgi:enoyl-[acyl-carrier protein] reductase I